MALKVSVILLFLVFVVFGIDEAIDSIVLLNVRNVIDAGKAIVTSPLLGSCAWIVQHIQREPINNLLVVIYANFALDFLPSIPVVDVETLDME